MILGGAYLTQCIYDRSLQVLKQQGDGTEKPILTYDLRVGPNSIDVTLGRRFLCMFQGTDVIDPMERYDVTDFWSELVDDSIVINPGDFVLGTVNERFLWGGDLEDRVAPMIDGRSTMGRLGIAVHVTAGFGDVGFQGNFTLEITNLGKCPVRLHAGMRIAQVFFQLVENYDTEAFTYDGAYHKDHIGVPVAPNTGPGRV